MLARPVDPDVPSLVDVTWPSFAYVFDTCRQPPAVGSWRPPPARRTAETAATSGRLDRADTSPLGTFVRFFLIGATACKVRQMLSRTVWSSTPHLKIRRTRPTWSLTVWHVQPAAAHFGPGGLQVFGAEIGDRDGVTDFQQRDDRGSGCNGIRCWPCHRRCSRAWPDPERGPPIRPRWRRYSVSAGTMVSGSPEIVRSQRRYAARDSGES